MGKKLLILTCFCSLLFYLAPCRAEDQVRLDGYKWINADISFKAVFLAGWFSAAENAIGAMHSVVIKSELCQKPITNDKQQILNRIVRRVAETEIGDPRGTGLQIIETLDKLYSDPRVKTWDIRDIMPLVRGRLNEGWTGKDLDEVIAYSVRERTFRERYKTADEHEKAKTFQEYLEVSARMPDVLRKFYELSK